MLLRNKHRPLGKIILVTWTHMCRRDAEEQKSWGGTAAKLSRVSPQARGMLDPTAWTPPYPTWQEERVLTRKHTFLSAWFLTVSCTLPHSVPICCRFSKSLFYSEELSLLSSMVKIVMIESFMSREQKWSRKAMEKSALCSSHLWTFELSNQQWNHIMNVNSSYRANQTICSPNLEMSQSVSTASILHLHWGPKWGLNSGNFYLP